MSRLGWVRAAGSSWQIGLALGQAGRAAVHRHLLTAPLWRAVTGPAHRPRVARMAGAVQTDFPAIWQELEGLAQGLDLPVEQVFAWNCRGDLLAHAPEGCTTVMIPGAAPVIAHNEDGFPALRGSCFMAECHPQGAPDFIAFCYPGSIPGHTFAVTAAGLVQTVNNIRLPGVAPLIPRMVLGRSVLACDTLTAAVDGLQGAASGGFHFALTHRRDRRLLSVEFGAGRVSVQEVSAPMVHANHALHLPCGEGGQIVTRSSSDRQARAEALLAQGRDPLTILRDTGGQGLPIRRDQADDPDAENTLATAVISVGASDIGWRIHVAATGGPDYSGLSGQA